MLRRGDAAVCSCVRRLRQLGAAAVQPRLSDAPPSRSRSYSSRLAAWLLRRRSTRRVSGGRSGVVWWVGEGYGGCSCGGAHLRPPAAAQLTLDHLWSAAPLQIAAASQAARLPRRQPPSCRSALMLCSLAPCICTLHLADPSAKLWAGEDNFCGHQVCSFAACTLHLAFGRPKRKAQLCSFAPCTLHLAFGRPKRKA
jgi:hypothetical protein